MCFENIPCKATYSVKIGVQNRLPNDVGFIPNLNINVEKLPYLVSGIHSVCACRKLREQTNSCVCIMRVSLASHL